VLAGTEKIVILSLHLVKKHA